MYSELLLARYENVELSCNVEEELKHCKGRFWGPRRYWGDVYMNTIGEGKKQVLLHLKMGSLFGY